MHDITRREALKKIYQTVVALGAASFISFDDLVAADKGKLIKPSVIWLHGTSCSGCSTSFLDIELVSVVDLITKFVNVIFHPDISSATGDQVVNIIEKTSKSRAGYIFVFEGGIPVAMPHACVVAHKPITHWVEKLASNAIACVAAGTCASMGGIPKMSGTITGSMTLKEFLASKNIAKPLINLPNCPMRPEHIAYVLLYFAKTGNLPKLDAYSRPNVFFSKTVHARCINYADYQEEIFAEFIGDDGCLLKVGCQGPITYNDCLVTGHNGNTNTCIRAGHPCIGCASDPFPRQIMFHTYNDKRVIQNGNS